MRIGSGGCGIEGGSDVRGGGADDTEGGSILCACIYLRVFAEHNSVNANGDSAGQKVSGCRYKPPLTPDKNDSDIDYAFFGGTNENDLPTLADCSLSNTGFADGYLNSSVASYDKLNQLFTKTLVCSGRSQGPFVALWCCYRPKLAFLPRTGRVLAIAYATSNIVAFLFIAQIPDFRP
eukprot:IDg17378t1